MYFFFLFLTMIHQLSSSSLCYIRYEQEQMIQQKRRSVQHLWANIQVQLQQGHLTCRHLDILFQSHLDGHFGGDLFLSWNVFAYLSCLFLCQLGVGRRQRFIQSLNEFRWIQFPCISAPELETNSTQTEHLRNQPIFFLISDDHISGLIIVTFRTIHIYLRQTLVKDNQRIRQYLFGNDLELLIGDHALIFGSMSEVDSSDPTGLTIELEDHGISPVGRNGVITTLAKIYSIDWFDIIRSIVIIIVCTTSFDTILTLLYLTTGSHLI